MSLFQLLILHCSRLWPSGWSGVLCVLNQITPPLMLLFSVVVIFWLQPALPIRGLDFWLPVATSFVARQLGAHRRT